MTDDTNQPKPKPTWQTHACFGRNCADWAAGAPHKCEVGTCQRYGRALAEWEAEQAKLREERDGEMPEVR